MDERALNELLECSVCLERLDATSKVLPCQHTFCKRCLEEIISTKNELRCPECRTLVEIRVEDLPTNILLIRLLEGMKNAKAGIGSLSLTPTTLAVTLAGFTSGTSSSGSRSPSSPVASGSASGGVRTSPGPKTVNTALPCAKALYNYDAKEPGDLTFKKGDMILLRKQVDENWFHGELNSHHGFFPATYVQVITELPQEVPKCKALYDFAISDKNEKDCLTFQKDEVLTVIRRVDDNWAEGKLGERIGIFPISFVDMNDSAKWLINTQASQASHGNQASGRPPSSVPSSSNSSSTSSTSSQGVPANAAGVDPEASPSNGSQSEPSSPVVKTPPIIPTVTAPQPTPRLSLMSQSVIVTSSHTSAVNPALVAVRQSGQKRHSLSTIGIHKALVPHAQHRHSVELTSSTLGTTLTPASATMVASSAPVQVTSATTVPKAVSQQTSQVPGAEGGGDASSGASLAPSIPAFYLALYNYKPQKEDEIELRKGEYYTVSEKCQDGWFKGTCLRSGDVGVFPGNYVQLVKISSKQVSKMAQGACSSSPSSSQTAAAKQQHVTVSRAHSFPKTSPLAASMDYQVKAGSQAVNRSPNTTAPHSRPITHVTQAQSRTSASLSQAQARASAQTVMSTSQNGLQKSPLASSSHSSQQRSPCSSHSQRSSSVPVLEKHLRGGSGSHHSPRSGRKSRHGHSHSHSHEKNGSAPHGVVPPTRSTSHGHSHSYSHSHNHSTSSPSHSMSSSTGPSIGVTPPNIVVGVGAVSPTLGATAAPPSKERDRESHREKDREQVKEKKERKEKDKERLPLDKLGMGLVKRFTKSKKSRSPPPPPEQTEGATAEPQSLHHRSGSLPNDSDEGATAATALPHHKKSGSLDSAQIKPPRTKPLLRERYRCIVPYPPQSDIEMELKVGDIVYVHKKRDDGWFKGTLQRTGKTGLFPGSFVETF